MIIGYIHSCIPLTKAAKPINETQIALEIKSLKTGISAPKWAYTSHSLREKHNRQTHWNADFFFLTSDWLYR